MSRPNVQSVYLMKLNYVQECMKWYDVFTMCSPATVFVDVDVLILGTGRWIPEYLGLISVNASWGLNGSFPVSTSQPDLLLQCCKTNCTVTCRSRGLSDRRHSVGSHPFKTHTLCDIRHSQSVMQQRHESLLWMFSQRQLFSQVYYLGGDYGLCWIENQIGRNYILAILLYRPWQDNWNDTVWIET